MKMMYLDESGDHRLRKIDPNTPLFILGGVVVDRLYVREVIQPKMKEFKRRVLGSEDIILHTVDMRNNAGSFTFLTDPVRREEFYGELNAVLDELDYTVIAVVIKKEEFRDTHGGEENDPYFYVLKLLIERFCLELQDENDDGFICAEKRNATQDRELLSAWENLRSNGTGVGCVPSHMIEDHIIGLELRDKRPNLAAMQIADLVLTPMSRFILERPEKAHQVQWSVVERKLRRVAGDYRGAGLVIKP
jgi:hypothetical protein